MNTPIDIPDNPSHKYLNSTSSKKYRYIPITIKLSDWSDNLNVNFEASTFRRETLELAGFGYTIRLQDAVSAFSERNVFRKGPGSEFMDKVIDDTSVSDISDYTETCILKHPQGNKQIYNRQLP